jgi:oxalate decarboxylase
MSDIERREFLIGTAAFAAGVTAALARTNDAKAGDPSFMNNVPDPLFAENELPNFKYSLEKSKAKVVGKNTAREATVVEFPISKSLAGVSMRLAPGGMRELHWHASAAEWAFVNKGRVRTTVLSPGGSSETNEFEPGDIWYFPRGFGHMLECLGDEPCHFILIFDNGYFSEYGTFSITDWIGHTPPALLAKNFGLPASTFASFPKEEVYFAQGAPPPAQAVAPLAGNHPGPMTHKYRLLSDDPRANNRGGKIWVVDSSRFPISKTVTGAILELEPGGLREMHWHPGADEWQYVLEGQVRMSLFGAKARYRSETFDQGDVGFVPQGYGHSIENVGNKTARVLVGFNSGIYQEVDLSEWIAGNPPDVLATNFSQPASLFEKFPRRDVFIGSGNAADK